MGTMREMAPSFAVEEMAMIDLPPLERRSTHAENQLARRCRCRTALPIESEQTCPVRSICNAELIGDHVVVACDQRRVVGVCRGVELENRIVVHEIKQIVSCPGQIQG